MNRPLLLWGFMGTGKSTVGRLLEREHGVRFVDLDAEVESRSGMTISQIFEQRGESGFRKLEQRILRELLAATNGATVVSLGGGALLDRGLRIDALGSAVVVTLVAQVDEIVRRVQEQDGHEDVRPLLAREPAATARQLLGQRAEAYAECHAQIRTDGLSPAEVAAEVLQVWAEDAVAVAAGQDSYCVRIGPGLIEPCLSGLLGKTSQALLVTDQNVSPLHGDKARRALSGHGTKYRQVILTPGEEHKSLQGLSAIYQGAFDMGLDRQGTLVGLGGGVVTDMTGFAAATWVRGVRWIGCPTTLLSMVDASVGGKTAVDFLAAKNSVGAFWQPAGVLCDVETLLTESERAYVGALSEVVKTALIGDAPLLELLEQNSDAVLARDLSLMREVVERCVRVKARIVALDEREAGLRATLNLGHTIGHALEAASGYTGLTHGEAVSLGLVAALRFGQHKGHTPPDLTERVLALLRKLRLPHQLNAQDLIECTKLLGHDKKRSGDQVRFVFASGAGKVFSEAIQLAELSGFAPQLADS